MWLAVAIVVVLGVGIMNAYNFMDGINGITAAYSMSVLLPLVYLNWKYDFIAMPLLVCVILADLVFGFFNFRKNARCFSGDVGAVSLAFIFIYSIGSLMRKTMDFSYIMLLAVYGVDSVLTIMHRIYLREDLGQAHRKHAYQLMANELKIPHIAVSSFYALVQLLISVGLIWLPVDHYVYAAVVLIVLCMAYILFKKKYYHLHEEYLASLKGAKSK